MPVGTVGLMDAYRSSLQVSLSNQLDFLLEDLANNDLSEDEIYVKLSRDEVFMLDNYNTQTEEALKSLEEVCGISLQSN